MLKKVISGGQTGVDRAGLDAAMEAGIPTGGFCPQGRKAEDGIIPSKYLLEELNSTAYAKRTEKNVLVSDGTLILNKGELSQGTKATHDFTVKHLKPCLVVQLDATPTIEPAQVVRWILGQQLSVLNVAGPRESKCSEGIYSEAFNYLQQVFDLLKEL